MDSKFFKSLVERVGCHVCVFLAALVLHHDDALVLPSGHEGVPHEGLGAHRLFESVLGVDIQSLLECMAATFHIYSNVEINLESNQSTFEFSHRLIKVGLVELHPGELGRWLEEHLLVHHLHLLHGLLLHHGLGVLGSDLFEKQNISFLHIFFFKNKFLKTSCFTL